MNMDFRQFSDQHWRRTIPETYAAFAKAAAVLEATPMPKPKRMPRLLREIAETVLDIPLDLGNFLSPFRFRAAIRIVRRHRHLRLNAPPRPSFET